MPVKRYWGREVDIHWLTDMETWSQMPHVTLDTTHIGTRGYDLLDVYERVRSRMVHVHLSNFNGKEHRRLEDGHLPLAELLQRLKQDGFEGAVSLEMGPEALQAEDEDQVQAHLQQMVAFCRECFDS
jgi:sugar phosphate isomerase/epimerase